MLRPELRRFISRAWQRLRPAPRESGTASAALRAEVAGTAPLLERILLENIVPFWYPRCIDAGSGGYRLHHDAGGCYKGPANKRCIAQARTLWFFARLARSGRMREAALDAARHGYDFLVTRMWDGRYGGFFWETDPDGNQPTISHKHLLAQSFALYAIAEYAIVSGDAGAARVASDTFAVMEREFHDPAYGGYWDRLSADWKTDAFPPARTRGPAGLKTLEVQIHAMEAVTTYLEASGDPLARDRLAELLRIQTERVFRREWGACSDAHHADWSPLLDPEHAKCSYGHDLENISLVVAACTAANLPFEPYLGFFRTTFLSALRWGADRRYGGFYKEGPLGKPATERSKFWWVQAEGMQASLELFGLTGDTLYARSYLTTLQWIVSQHVDWEHGEWHATPPQAGQVSADKAGVWKEPYHTGRAILRCQELAIKLRGAERPREAEDAAAAIE